MKEAIEEIIKKLAWAQELMHQNRIDEAKTAIYEAESRAIFARDNGA
jgi:hypothetical protein